MRPYYSMYYLTDWCNAKCGFCDIWTNPAYRPSSLERVAWDMADLKRLGIRFVDFTGGEPLLRREAPTIFGMAEEAGLRYGFTNNGSLFERRWPELEGLRPFSMSFSLDSPDPEEHNTSRQLPDNFGQIERSVSLALNDGWPASLLFTVTPKTFPKVDRMVELGDSWGCPVLLNPLFAYKAVGGSLTADQLLALRKYRWDRRASLHVGYLEWLAREGGNRVENRTCRSMDTHVVVAPDSSLYVPCYHYSQFHLPTPDGIYEAVTSPAWADLAAKAGRYSFCEGCAINCYLEHGVALRHPARTALEFTLHRIKIAR